MPKYSILFCRFPGNNIDDPDTTDYFAECIIKAKSDPRISDIWTWRKSDTPIPMVRNEACEVAKKYGADFLVLLDNDMKPDAYLASNPNRLGTDSNAKPFWDTALDFLIQHQGPAVIASPYCGPPPIENVYVFQWINYASNEPKHGVLATDKRGPGSLNMKIEAFNREEAALRTGIEEVAALPTGLMMLHTAALDRISKPYFRYEYTDDSESVKATTEDCYTTRNLSLAGVPQYVAWDCWSGHWKRKCVGKPMVTPVSVIKEEFREAIIRGCKPNEKLVMFGEGKNGNRARFAHVNGGPEPVAGQ